jgi:hypothetical protein
MLLLLACRPQTVRDTHQDTHLVPSDAVPVEVAAMLAGDLTRIFAVRPDTLGFSDSAFIRVVYVGSELDPRLERESPCCAASMRLQEGIARVIAERLWQRYGATHDVRRISVRFAPAPSQKADYQGGPELFYYPPELEAGAARTYGPAAIRDR